MGEFLNIIKLNTRVISGSNILFSKVGKKYQSHKINLKLFQKIEGKFKIYTI